MDAQDPNMFGMSNTTCSVMEHNMFRDGTVVLCSFETVMQVLQENKNIKNVKRCRDGMPKSMQTRQG